MFLSNDGELSRMEEVPYRAEAVLQDLLVDYPDLLPGDSTEGSSEWLLVKQELGIASETDGGSRWSLDHLFLDRDGVPTLVEVKRSSDTRIRREVVGQMLDYAANGSAIWSQEKIRASFETGRSDPEGDLGQFLAGEVDPADYWERVSLNLKAGRLRLVFVADRIPSELRRIIEFLNDQMTQTEVIGVEIKQFRQVGGQLVNFVSEVVGRTEAAKQAKNSSGRTDPKWTPLDFEREIESMHSPEIARRVMELHRKFVEAGAAWNPGTGSEPSLNYRLGADTGTPVHLSLYLANLAINFAFVRRDRTEEEMSRLLDLSRSAVGASPYLESIPSHGWNVRPGMPYKELFPSDEAAERFADLMIRASIPG